jgi:hypothetical protein
MRTLYKILLLIYAPIAIAQTQTVQQPPCVLNYAFVANGSSTNLANSSSPSCDKWTLSVYSTSGVSAFSLTFQSAPAATSSTPGTFVTYAGTTATGSNPLTAAGISTFTNGTVATPWLRLNLTGFTGSGVVYGVLQGTQSLMSKGGGGGGGGSPTGPAGGDLGGTYPNPTAVHLSHVTDASLANAGLANPATTVNGQTCTLGSTCTVTGAPTGTAGGDLSGTYPNPTVAKVNGNTPGGTCPGGQFINVLSTSAIPTCGTPAAGGAAILGYSGSAIVLPTAGTTFLAPVGGAASSVTEANVTGNAPAAAAISQMYVSLSAAPGTGNSIAFTWRDAGASTTVTCTVSGATATACNDTTHTFTPVVGDTLDVQVVTTGIVVIAPAVKIISEYGLSGGGPSGPSAHFQYYPAAACPPGCSSATSSTWNIFALPGFNATPTTGGPANFVGLVVFSAGTGVNSVIASRLPSTWSGANPTVDIDVVLAATGGNITFIPSSACAGPGTDTSTLTYTAGTPVTTAATSGGSVPLYQQTLTVPVTGCTAGNLLFVSIARSASDTFSGSVFAIGANLGITY